ncbi:MAG: hypothetical protein U0169_00825 [Polyangiaceae bacterium]
MADETKAKRRLPVLQSPPKGGDAGDDEARPPWHWIGFGAVATFAAWLPLAYAAESLSARITDRIAGPVADLAAAELRAASLSARDRALLTAGVVGTRLGAMAIAAFSGGYLVGRFGAPAGIREAALAGFVVALSALVLAWSATGFLAASLVLLALFPGVAAWGARVGRR